MASGKRKERDLFSVKAVVDVNQTNKKRKKQKQNKEGGNAQKKQKIDDQSAVEILPLTFVTVIAGQVILGCVQEVRNYELVVSLPDKLVGSVTIAQISKAYTALLTKVKEDEDDAEAEIHTLQELFRPGEFVVTRVISVEDINGRYKVNLTLLPQEVNFGICASHLHVGYVLPCAVTSVEDNGFVMDTGIPNIRGAFLKNTAIDGSGVVGVGSVVRCIINKILRSEDGNSLRLILSADSKAVCSATLHIADTTNLALLLPGTAVNTSISKVQKEGLNLLMAGFDGVVSRLHLKCPFDQLNQYKLSQKVRARVLYIMPLTKVVHFTLQKTICPASLENDPLHGFKVGDRIKDAEIYEAKSSGVYLKIGKECRGFCSGNRLTDKDKAPKRLTRDFHVGARHMCRLIKYDYMDKLFIVSLQKSVLEQQLVGYSEVQAGKILKATIKGYNAHGADVAVSKFVNGQIPFLQLTDTYMKHPERKHKVGDIVRARVLKVNPERRHLLLTCKTHLVDSKEPIVTEYTKDVENIITEGCIVQVNPRGLLIAMYNDVRGFAPKMNVSTEPIDNLKTLFTEGQVVRCRIVSVDPEKKNILLSLIIDGTKPFGKLKSKQAMLMSEIQVRDKVSCIVKEIKEDTIQVNIKPKDCRAEIPVHHLSDDINNSRFIKELLREGDEIHNAVVFRKDATVITLTLKYSVYHWVYSGSREAHLKSEFLENESYPASITKIQTYGLFVLIPMGDRGRRALVHVTNLTDSGKWFDCTNLGVSIGQSISVAYKGMDNRDRPILSASFEDNMKNVTQSSIQLLHCYFRDRYTIKSGLLKRGGKKSWLAEFDVGIKLKGTVTAITPLGVLVTVEKDKITGILSPDHQDAKYEVGQEITTCVLHVNIKEECLELTARPDLQKILNIKENSKLKVGMNVKCEVLLAKKNFIMVVLKTRCVGMVAYLPSLRHTNDLNGRHCLYTVGQECCMVIKHIEGTLVLGVLKQHDRDEDLNILSERPTIVLEQSFDAPAEKKENVEADTCSGEEMILRKIQRVRTDSQSSMNSMEIITETNEGEEKNDEQLKILTSDSAPQIDEEMLHAVQRRKRLERQQLKLSERKNNKRIEVASEDVEEIVNVETNEERAPESQQRLEAVSDSAVEDPDAVEDVKEPKKKKSKKHSKINKKKNQEMGVARDDQMEAVDSGVDENMASDDGKLKTYIKSKPCLKLGTGFVWEVPDTVENIGKDSSESEDEETAAKKKKIKKLTKSEREVMAKEEERHLHQLELARLEKDRLPQSALDYEELLQLSPNSSAVWIQFISFHLESAEVDKAKAVARRALQVIDIREEEERLNIWTVLLRLEVLYGTSESVAEAYHEALTTNDQLKVHMAMAMVYSESNKLNEAEKVYFTMTKKFGKVRDVWIKAGIFFFTQDKADEAHRYMERALFSLDKKEHVELINRFGQLEFRFGEAERGRTMFESLLSNFPKRIDIWSVYVDLLTKREDIEGARHVLERMTGLKLRLRKMRFVFKKFLDFEKEHGTPQSVETVRKRVEEFVTSTLHQDG